MKRKVAPLILSVGTSGSWMSSSGCASALDSLKTKLKKKNLIVGKYYLVIFYDNGDSLPFTEQI